MCDEGSADLSAGSILEESWRRLRRRFGEICVDNSATRCCNSVRDCNSKTFVLKLRTPADQWLINAKGFTRIWENRDCIFHSSLTLLSPRTSAACSCVPLVS